MNKTTLLLVLLASICLNTQAQSFEEEQSKIDRVKQATVRYESRIRKMFRDSGLIGSPRFIYWRAFKMEDQLELWAADSGHHKHKLIKTYKICKGSGDLGPKRKFGDLQVPEGLYYIDRYNPSSSYHLSFRIAYPNESDLVFADKDNPGNEIYVHGDCVTIGCLPMTDSIMDEIYVITMKAQSFQGIKSKIPIDVFPCHFNAKNWNYLKFNYGHKPNLLNFWKNIEEGYSFFKQKRIPPGYWVDQKGIYHIVYPQNAHLHDPNH
jgi:murein L,D-transpeptidase YafK